MPLFSCCNILFWCRWWFVASPLASKSERGGGYVLNLATYIYITMLVIKNEENNNKKLTQRVEMQLVSSPHLSPAVLTRRGAGLGGGDGVWWPSW
jgi:hypothetical protein